MEQSAWVVSVRVETNTMAMICMSTRLGRYNGGLIAILGR